MEQIKSKLVNGYFALPALFAASAASIYSSPKWGFALFAWLAPVCWLYFFRIGKLKRKILWFLPVMLFTEIASSYDVAPFPIQVLVIVSLIALLKKLIIFLADRWLTQKNNHFLMTLLFPALCVSIEYIDMTMGGGAWWSVANTQYHFHWLTQLASVTGLWGISFMVYWFGSVIVWSIGRSTVALNYEKGLRIYASVLGAVLIFGIIRYHTGGIPSSSQVKIAGVTVPSIRFLETAYRDCTGEQLQIDQTSSVTSPQLAKANLALIPFIEKQDSIKYANTIREMRRITDSLFVLSQAEADRGAKIISWSEANSLSFKNDAPSIEERGKQFARRNNVYLLMAMGIIEPGKLTPGKKFLENKAMFIGPDGNVLNVFHKNNPVPFAEASTGGDGVIPVINTKYGPVATSICYDADMALQMKQLGKKNAGVLLLPSGDWHAIAPFHSYMASFRGIENGTSVFRQASGGLSLATDYRGKEIGSLDYYQPGTKTWNVSVPASPVFTLYSFWGDALAYLCFAFVAIVFVYVLIKKRSAGRSANSQMTGNLVSAS